MEKLEPLSPVVTENQVKEISEKFGTPVYVYSQDLLERQAEKALRFPNAFGLSVRYAMKANSNKNILEIFARKGLKIDASSAYEARRCLSSFNPEDVLLTTQQLSDDKYLKKLVSMGIDFNACSLWQVARYGKYFPNTDISVRINPGLGSGHNNRTNTGGPSSSFGIWHEDFNSLVDVLEGYSLNVKRVHSHIGSGSDPEIWEKVAGMTLNYVEKFLDEGHDVGIVNLGGGYKVARMSDGSDGKTTDLEEIGNSVKRTFEEFAEQKGKKLHLEIEPGTYLVANSGCLISKVIDLKRTSDYRFIIVDSGITEIARPALYGAQHPISVVIKNSRIRKEEEFIVAGHCCESGDILTPEKGDPEKLETRRLIEPEIGEYLVVGGAGAYCSSMATGGYNSFPKAAEVLIDNKDNFNLIREREDDFDLIKREKWASIFLPR